MVEIEHRVALAVDDEAQGVPRSVLVLGVPFGRRDRRDPSCGSRPACPCRRCGRSTFRWRFHREPSASRGTGSRHAADRRRDGSACRRPFRGASEKSICQPSTPSCVGSLHVDLRVSRGRRLRHPGHASRWRRSASAESSSASCSITSSCDWNVLPVQCHVSHFLPSP